jgi:hypothetical protein
MRVVLLGCVSMELIPPAMNSLNAVIAINQIMGTFQLRFEIISG